MSSKDIKRFNKIHMKKTTKKKLLKSQRAKVRKDILLVTKYDNRHRYATKVKKNKKKYEYKEVED